MRTTLTALAAVAALCAAGQAAAHARLIQSNPKTGSTIAAPKELALHYSETIVPAGSYISVAGPAGPLATGPLTVDPKDKRAVHAVFTAPPAHGAYHVKWHMKTEDGHETDGEFAFNVQ